MSNNINTNVETAREQRRIDYILTFGTEHGNKVLEDLKQQMGIGQTSFVAGADHATMAYNEGLKDTVRYIMQMMQPLKELPKRAEEEIED